MALYHLTSTFLLLLTLSSQSWSLSTTKLPQTSSANSTLHYVLKNGTTSLTQESAVYCTFDSDCHSVAGFYSECYSGRCICDLGYRSMNGLSTCQKQYCTYNSDCTLYFYGTRCDFTNTCVCNYNYYKNVFSQTCSYSSGGGSSDTGAYVGVPLGGFFFFFFLFLICFFICRRRRRVVRVVRPGGQFGGTSSVQVVQQPQARPGPSMVQPPAPQQQSYYAQNNQSAPYPTSASYGNPNYVQQAPPPPYNPSFASQPAAYPTGGKY